MRNDSAVKTTCGEVFFLASLAQTGFASTASKINTNIKA